MDKIQPNRSQVKSIAVTKTAKRQTRGRMADRRIRQALPLVSPGRLVAVEVRPQAKRLVHSNGQVPRQRVPNLLRKKKTKYTQGTIGGKPVPCKANTSLPKGVPQAYGDM